MKENMNELKPCLIYQVDDTTVTRYRHPVYIGRWIDVKTEGYRTYTRVPGADTQVSGLHIGLAGGDNSRTTAELFLAWPRRESSPILAYETLFDVQMDGAWVPVAWLDNHPCVVVDHPYEKGVDGRIGVRHYYRIPQDRIEGKRYKARPLSDRLLGYREAWDYVTLEEKVPTHTLTYREEGKDADAVMQVLLADHASYEVLPGFAANMSNLRYVGNTGRLEPIQEEPAPTPAPEYAEKGPYWHAICQLWDAPALPDTEHTDTAAACAQALEAIKAAVHKEFLPLLGTEVGDDNVLVAAANLHRIVGVSPDDRFPALLPKERLRKYGPERLNRAVRSAHAAALYALRNSKMPITVLAD